jgi:hypothetical protein
VDGLQSFHDRDSVCHRLSPALFACFYQLLKLGHIVQQLEIGIVPEIIIPVFARYGLLEQLQRRHLLCYHYDTPSCSFG